jgi:peptidyl-prolyl cis-trans isomerase C
MNFDIVRLMNQTVTCGLFFVFVSLTMTGCDRPPESPVIARVGANEITADELKARLEETPPPYRQYAATAEGRRLFLDLLIREKVVLTEAKNLGIPQDPAYRQAVAKFKADWKRRLKDYEETLQVDSALRRMRTTNLAATDTEVDKYYEDHRADYDKPVEVIASHILLSTQQEAEAALARLKDKEPFERVAREMSKDPDTAVRGGRLAPFRRGVPVPEFEEAAAKMKVGETSGIVKSQFGFHIIRKLGEKMLPPRSAADAKEEIRAKLEREKFDQWVAAKKALLGVTVDEQAMSRLTLEEPQQP